MVLARFARWTSKATTMKCLKISTDRFYNHARNTTESVPMEFKYIQADYLGVSRLCDMFILINNGQVAKQVKKPFLGITFQTVS